ncbi:MAG: cobalt ECF transporter T component CbiQ [Deltaproteobacteria bacterium]|nr:cobalt ECF transporter T component CbiQ [Deltaproteobacteria bacterium]
METLKIPEWLKQGGQPVCAGAVIREGFIEKNLKAVSSFLKEMLSVRNPASGPAGGLFQGVSARARIGGVFVLLVGAVFMDNAISLFFLISTVIFIACLSHAGLFPLLKRVVPAVIFSLVVIWPVFFNFFTAGREFLVFDIFGSRVALTEEGLFQGGFFILRVTATASLVSLLFLTAKEADIFGGLKGLGVPAFFVTAIFMTFRYVFILLKIVEDTSLARKSRTINPAVMRDGKRWFSSRAGFLLQRALYFSEEVTLSMAARGFTGRIKVFASVPLRGKDYLWLGFAFFVFFMSIGRF